MFRLAIFAGLAIVALSGSASACVIGKPCPPPPCKGVKCYVIDPLPDKKFVPLDSARTKSNLTTPSIPIPPPRARR